MRMIGRGSGEGIVIDDLRSKIENKVDEVGKEGKCNEEILKLEIMRGDLGKYLMKFIRKIEIKLKKLRNERGKERKKERLNLKRKINIRKKNEEKINEFLGGIGGERID